MIIDVHTHIWSSDEQLGAETAEWLRTRATARSDRVDATPAAHERAMACVDAAFVFGFRSQQLGANIPNELVAEFVARDPHRRIGICGIDPMSDDALDRIDAGIDLGLAGVTVSPASQGFHPAHSQAMRSYEHCAAKSLPLFVTAFQPLTAAATLEFGRPSLWDEVARSLPQLPIVIGSLGYPWIDELFVMLAKHGNVYADISGVVSRPWQLYNALLTATALGVIDKLLFGSGFPFETPVRAIEAIYSVNACRHGTQMPSVPRTLIRSIVERDSTTCLGLEAEIPAVRRSVGEEETGYSGLDEALRSGRPANGRSSTAYSS